MPIWLPPSRHLVPADSGDLLVLRSQTHKYRGRINHFVRYVACYLGYLASSNRGFLESVTIAVPSYPAWRDFRLVSAAISGRFADNMKSYHSMLPYCTEQPLPDH